MEDQPPPSPARQGLEAAFDHRLAAALQPPQTPADLYARVMAAVERESVADLELARRRLRDDHARSVAAVRSRFLRLARDSLVVVAPLIVTMILIADPLARALSGVLGADAPIFAALLALGGGALAGVTIWDGAGRRSGRPALALALG